jgi:hypothetical protein
MTTHRRSFSPTLVAVLAAVITWIVPTAAYAIWSVTGSGRAATAAAVMPTGSTPSARAGIGSAVLSWTAVTLPDGAAVTGYVITRYDAATGASLPAGGTCSGVVTATTCTDDSLGAGSWSWTDRPVYGNWNGAESQPSRPISVAPPQ